jgi:hypothetical protein
MPLLALLPPLPAFQSLVLFSLSATGVLTFLYLRRLGAVPIGAYVAGLSFSLGPYLVGHLGDTATLVAAPTLPLLLLAAESHMNRGTTARAAGLAGALALLFLAGSPEAARAGAALVAGRLLVGHLFPQGGRGPTVQSSLLALLAGVLLAAPQLLPTLLTAREAGRPVTGLAQEFGATLPGATGLVLRYASHTPAPALALAALPLVLTETAVRVLGVALGLCVALQWGRGPLAAPGALPLVFDLTLATLAGLSLSSQWRARCDAWGRRLRAHFLFASLATAAALSVAAAALGPLPQTLAGSVGVLALALILYFSLAGSQGRVKAGLFLLPLSVSFVLQPDGRRIWEGAPLRDPLLKGSPTRQAIDRAMGVRRHERVLTLIRDWPPESVADLAYGASSALGGRRNANGYDPMVSLRTRAAFDGMGVGGGLPAGFFKTDPARLEILGIRFVQVPTAALAARADSWGLGDVLDLAVLAGRPRFFPVPITPATEIRLASWMDDAVSVPDGTVVAEISARLATGRQLTLPVRAGLETAEWAHERPDVASHVAHRQAPILESWTEATFEGHRYFASIKLPGRYVVDGLRVERLPGAGRLLVSRLGFADAATGRVTPVSLAAGYVSDQGRFRELAATPAVRLLEVGGSLGRARVVESLRVLREDEGVLRGLRMPRSVGFDPRREALATAVDVVGVVLPPGAQSARAEVVRPLGNWGEFRAAGPGVLLIAEGWDPGWRATLDGSPTRILRLNYVQMGVVLPSGMHRVVLRYQVRGLELGCVLAAAAAGGLAWAYRRERRRRREA